MVDAAKNYNSAQDTWSFSAIGTLTPVWNMPNLQRSVVISGCRIPERPSLSFSEFIPPAYGGKSHLACRLLHFPAILVCICTHIQTYQRQQLLRFERWLESALRGLYFLRANWKTTMLFGVARMSCSEFPFDRSNRTPNTVRSALRQCSLRPVNSELCDVCFRIEDQRPPISEQHLV